MRDKAGSVSLAGPGEPLHITMHPSVQQIIKEAKEDPAWAEGTSKDDPWGDNPPDHRILVLGVYDISGGQHGPGAEMDMAEEKHYVEAMGEEAYKKAKEDDTLPEIEGEHFSWHSTFSPAAEKILQGKTIEIWWRVTGFYHEYEQNVHAVIMVEKWELEELEKLVIIDRNSKEYEWGGEDILDWGIQYGFLKKGSFPFKSVEATKAFISEKFEIPLKTSYVKPERPLDPRKSRPRNPGESDNEWLERTVKQIYGQQKRRPEHPGD